jgi:hypothetical protein
MSTRQRWVHRTALTRYDRSCPPSTGPAALERSRPNDCRNNTRLHSHSELRHGYKCVFGERGHQDQMRVVADTYVRSSAGSEGTSPINTLQTPGVLSNADRLAGGSVMTACHRAIGGNVRAWSAKNIACAVTLNRPKHCSWFTAPVSTRGAANAGNVNTWGALLSAPSPS